MRAKTIKSKLSFLHPTRNCSLLPLVQQIFIGHSNISAALQKFCIHLQGDG